MIQLRNVTLRRGPKVLLDGVTVTINPGEKVGLVGRNGAGKSTLFALLNGSLHEDAGDFSRPAQWQLAQVAQHMPETDDRGRPLPRRPSSVQGEIALILRGASLRARRWRMR